MEKNANEIKQIKSTFGFVPSSVYFYFAVKDGGKWDIKLQPDWTLDSNYKYLFHGRDIRYDDPGNINFGYAGSVLFPEIALCAGAGLNQYSKYGTSCGDISTFFDDPRDNEMIKYGIQLYEKGTK